MIDQIKRHPSDIAQSAVKYLKSVKLSEKTRRLYEDVLDSLPKDAPNSLYISTNFLTTGKMNHILIQNESGGEACHRLR